MAAKSFTLTTHDLCGPATMAHYEQLMSQERPIKFDQQTSSYHLATQDEPRCDECLHFFGRHIDALQVCEIVRPVPEEPIRPEFTCKFQTPDGTNFPLYDQPK